MSRHAYFRSGELDLMDEPFDALIMAAMRRADTENAEILEDAFPGIWVELHDRYHAPGGLLAGETNDSEVD